MIALTTIFALLLAQTPATNRQAQMGVATGQVSTLDGKPAPGIRVSIMVLPDPKDPAGAALLSLAETDGSGRFRLENIPPGKYYIQAGLLDFPTYYPGVPTLEGATPISIEAGITTEGLDFKMKRPPGVRVSGRVPLNLNPQASMAILMGGVSGATASSAIGVRPGSVLTMNVNGTITTITMGGGGFGMPIGPPQRATIGADGTFEFLKVKPGHYVVIVPGTQFNRGILVDDQDIDLDSYVAPSPVPPKPGFKVSGVVGANSIFAGIPNQRVVLLDAFGWSLSETTMGTSGRFEFSNVPPGDYTLTAAPASRSHGVAIAVRDRDIDGIAVPGSIEVTGLVIVEDPTGAATSGYFSTASTTLVATSANGSTVYSQIGRGTLTVYADGSAGSSFTVTLHEKEYQVSVANLPSGLTLRALTYGTVDLLKEPLKLDGSSRTLPIRVTLVKEP